MEKGKRSDKRKYTSIVFLSHSTGKSTTFKINALAFKFGICFLIISLLILSSGIGIKYLYSENSNLSENIIEIETEMEASEFNLTNIIDKQTYIISDKAELIDSIDEKTSIIEEKVDDFSQMIGNVTRQYVSGMISGTLSAGSTEEIQKTFVSKIKQLKVLLEEIVSLDDSSNNEIGDLSESRQLLENYMDNIPTFWPVSCTTISDSYGYRWHPIYGDYRLHTGVDIASSWYDDIRASASGTVVLSNYISGYGYCIKIDHGEGIATRYAHCSELLVSEGDVVEKGELIARVGSTGTSTGPHLHFEVIISGTAVDPMQFFENLR